jgi:hypothetical protein
MLSSGLFPGVCSLNANVSEHSVYSIFIGKYPLTYEDGADIQNTVKVWNQEKIFTQTCSKRVLL